MAGEPEVVIPAEVFRDLTVPIASKALFEVERMNGGWYRVAGYSEAGCAGAEMTFDHGTDGVIAMRLGCRVAGGAIVEVEGDAQLTGPGRMAVRFSDVPEMSGEYWVLWVDESYRTAVIGTPSGGFGWVFDRNEQISPDRMHAAREVLDFNGYDLNRLIGVLQ